MAKAQSTPPLNPIVDQATPLGTIDNVLAVVEFLQEVEYARRPSDGSPNAIRYGGYLISQAVIDALTHAREQVALERRRPAEAA